MFSLRVVDDCCVVFKFLGRGNSLNVGVLSEELLESREKANENFRKLNEDLLPGTNQYDTTLKRIPSYRANDIKWGYAKDDGTVRCRLGIMMGL
jgi:hypothetical protein